MSKEVLYTSTADINYEFPGDPKPVILPEIIITPIETEEPAEEIAA